MTRYLFALAFVLGLMVIGWIGSGFIGTNSLALVVTAIIACVFVIGFLEQLQFRQATTTLSQSLNAIPTNIDVLGDWLSKLHPSLHTPVRLRIEGSGVSLPGPVLTPYLVGLLVMLGLLGTFIGMVVTLKGAVFALEGTTELQAIRAGLAAPIEGLGLAFGTSVAGVAASAMLGLISTLTRRERVIATQRLDSAITNEFRGFSLVHNRQETYKALQYQAQALPQVADKLDALTQHLAQMSTDLADKLIANQQQFHNAMTTVYTDLAASVDQSLKTSLADSGRLAGESIKPVLEQTLSVIANEAQHTQQQVAQVAQAQLQTMTDRFETTAQQVTAAWQAGVGAHQQANEALISQFEQTSQSMFERQKNADAQQLAQWTAAAEQTNHRVGEHLHSAAQQLVSELKQATEAQQSSLNEVTAGFATTTANMAQWLEAQQQAERDKLAQWQDAAAQSNQQISTHLQNASQQLVAELKQATEAQQSSLNEVTTGFASTTAKLTDWVEGQQQVERDKLAQWQDAAAQSNQQISTHLQSASQQLVAELKQATEAQQSSLNEVTAGFASTTADLTQWAEGQRQVEQDRLALWQAAAEQSQQAISEYMQSATQQLVTGLSQTTTAQQSAIQEVSTTFASTVAAFAQQYQNLAQQSTEQQQRISTTLETTARQVIENTQASSKQIIDDITVLVDAGESAMKARMDAESGWLTQHSERMSELTTSLKQELAALREAEEQRGQAAVARLADLEGTVANHLATLGSALEEPMTRLITLASETPKAAADVIEQLRREISTNVERDNAQLEERVRIMTELNQLLVSLKETSAEQCQAIESLVGSSGSVLKDISEHFSTQVANEVAKLANVSDNVTASTVEAASLGDAFSLAIELFSESNDKLIDNLARIEGALEKSTQRSDEQLAYYVAQAREIIDHSMMSQKEIFDELRQLNAPSAGVSANEVN